MMTPDLPTNAGRYCIEALLGQGAMGVVYKAWDPLVHRHVAIKMVRDNLLEGQERADYLARFLNEARLGGLCDHPNIVSLYDMGGSDEEPYLVLQYVDGLGLNKALPKGTKLPLDEVIPIALQVLAALEYAHMQGIVHRDVKPANIILTYQGRLKITDFGVSHSALLSEAETTPLLIGTPNYMSPEQCAGRPVDSRSDLFSFGSVLYEMLSGKKAFEGREYSDTSLLILNTEPEPLCDLRSDLPAGIATALSRILAKDPNDRFSSAREFSDVLRRATPQFDLSFPLPLPQQQIHSAPEQTVSDDTAENTSDHKEISENDASLVPDDNDDDYDGDATVIIAAEDNLPPLSHPVAETEWLNALEGHLLNLYGPASRQSLRKACEQAETKEEILALVLKNKRRKKDLLALFLPAQPINEQAIHSEENETSTENIVELQNTAEETLLPQTEIIPEHQNNQHPEELSYEEPSYIQQEEDPPLTDEDIIQVSAALSDVLGPVATPVLRRASLRAKNYPSFVALCETYIKHQGDQERFRNLLAATTRT